MPRLTALMTAGFAVAAALAAPAGAALWLLFSQTTATPGDEVAVHTAGGAFTAWVRSGALRKAPPLRLFLVRAELADRINGIGDRRLIDLGRLTVDRRGVGSARFRVPNVRPGDYDVLLRCTLCAPRSAGRTLMPAGPFPGPFPAA